MPDASLPFSRRLATALYAAALLVTAPPGALAQSAPEPAAIGFDVPAGDLAPALRALASQAKATVIEETIPFMGDARSGAHCQSNQRLIYHN
jgi:outer membrane receptor for ferric coprogen and ferric-rhodotorulic acid